MPGAWASVYTVAVSQETPEVVAAEFGTLTGEASAFYQCVFARADGPFSFVQLPQKRALYHLRIGEVAAALPLAKHPTRDAYAEFGGELLSVDFVSVSFRKIPDIAATAGLTYAFLREFAVERFVTDPAAKIIEASRWEQVVALLESGRADLTIIPRETLDKLMALTEQSAFVQLAGTMPVSLYIADQFKDTPMSASIKEAVKACKRIEPVQER
ncbi:hypothetical protein [Marinobacter sp.]|uniref:hypothetical protein n=1 Tax=Marinobacter sp. TaxID=50741 RepID=UPI00384B779D